MIKHVLFPALALMPLTLAAQQKHVDLTGKPVASIGEPFTKIAGVRELAANLVVVTDLMERSVLVADFAKRTAAKIGRKGRGPEEYQYPSAPLAGSGNTVWILDPSLARGLEISAPGRITSSIGIPVTSMGSPPTSDEDGRFYFQGSDFNPESGRFSDTVPIVRWTAATRRLDTVARVWSGGRVILERKSGRASLSRSITPFPHLDAWVALPGGRLAIVTHDPFRIDVVTKSGTIVRGDPIPFTPIPITAVERDAYRASASPGRSNAAMRDGSVGPPAMSSQFDDAEFPKAMPAFVATTVRATPEGDIWIGRSHTTTDKTWSYEIFDAGGRRIGDATLKANCTVVGFGAHVVYVARVNPDDDLVYLEKFAR